MTFPSAFLGRSLALTLLAAALLPADGPPARADDNWTPFGTPSDSPPPRRKKAPPATPDAPHAHTADTRHNNKAEPKSTGMFKVWAAAKVKTLMVQAAPAMLMVAPNGMETE